MRPALLKIEGAGAQSVLRFGLDGEAIFQWVDPQSAIAEFRYQKVYDEAPTEPATAFVLVNGQGTLPAEQLEDPALANACSQAAALRKTPLETPGQPVPVPEPGQRIEVVVDAFAGHKIELIDPVFSPLTSKWIVVDHGVLVFLDDGRVVFLLGAHQADADYVRLNLLDEPQDYTARELLKTIKPELSFEPSEGSKAEFASNYQVVYDPPRELTLEALDKTSFPLCQQEIPCRVFGFEGNAYVTVSGAEQLGLAPFAPSAISVADLFADPSRIDPFGGSVRGLMLAAAGPDAIVLPEGDGGAAELPAYWLARHPEDRVVVIEDFFDRAAQATPPQLSLGDSRFVAADVLLAAGRPADGFEGIAGTVVEIDASAFPPWEPEHGGGAGFSPLDFGALGEGLRPILEQDPTAPPVGLSPPTIHQLPPTDGNRAPIAADDLAATFRDAPITIDPLANDFDPDPNDSIQVVRAELLLEVSVPQSGAQSSEGAAPMATRSGVLVEIEGGTTVEYTPSSGFSGTATLRYVISDGRAESEPAIISVAVAASNLGPTAEPDRAETPVDTPVTIDVLANDEDSDNIPNSLLPRPIPLTIERIVDGPDHGSAMIVGAPDAQQIRYDPNAGFSGVDSFSYAAFDGLSASPVPGVITVVVGDVTFAALPDDASTDEATPIVIDVLANDEFDRTAPFELEPGPSLPERGVIRVNLDDTVTFDPDGAFDALDDGERAQVTFDYTLTQAGLSSTAEVSVTVAGLTDPSPTLPPVLTVDAEVLPPGELPFAFQTTQPFPEADGVDPADLTLDLDRAVSVEFQSSEAAFANSLGWYAIEEGRPVDPQLLFADVGAVAPGTIMDLGLLPAGTAIGFFLIQDGFSRNPGLDDPGAELEFRSGPGGTLQLFRVDGALPDLVEGDVLHTVDAFNPGGETQTVSGLSPAADDLSIGFEDKVRADPLQNSDDDFNDAIFDLHYASVILDESELLLDVTITNDEPELSGAIVRLFGGGRLLLGDVLDEVEGIRLSEQSTDDRLVLEGLAALDAYEQVLEAVEVEPPPNEAARQISFQVIDVPAEPPVLSNIATIDVILPSVEDAAAAAAAAV